MTMDDGMENGNATVTVGAIMCLCGFAAPHYVYLLDLLWWIR